jgi:hypothetical protein
MPRNRYFEGLCLHFQWVEWSFNPPAHSLAIKHYTPNPAIPALQRTGGRILGFAWEWLEKSAGLAYTPARVFFLKIR